MAIAGVTHNVYRSATAPVPLDGAHRIASGLRVGLYLDRSGRAGLYYVVTAQNAAGESGPSNTAQARGIAPLRPYWPDPLLLLPAPLLLVALGRSRRRMRWAAPLGAALLGVAAVCLGAGLLLSGGAEAAVAPGNAGAEEMVTRTITYTYDPLGRLTGAEYSTGERFGYQYDALSNVTVMTETITATIVTHYAYNAANQLLTARRSDDGITWHYTFDRRGNLIRQTPGGTAPAEGETRYTYDAAGHLVRVELYTAGTYIPLAEAAYNADGEQVRLTTWAEGMPFTVTYGVFQGQLLASAGGPTTTLYLQGRALIGEYRGGWTYPLRDGEGSVRQEVDEEGNIVGARSYKPFGGILEERGRPGSAFGFLGAQLDRISGLLYAGGRYYDPATGRYLTPGRGFDPYRPRTLNPYTPMQDPTLWLLAPVGVVAALLGRKKWRRYGYWLLVLVVVGVGASMLLSGCGPQPTPPPPVPPSQPPTQPPTSTPTPTPTPAPTPTPRPLTEWEIQYGEAIARAAHDLLNNANDYYIWGALSHPPDEDATNPPPRERPQPGTYWGACTDLYERTGGRIPIVCADVIAISYAQAGLDLEKTYPKWNARGFLGDQSHSSRDVWMLHVLLTDHHQEHDWNGDTTPVELGDMAFWPNYGHSSVVAEIQGNRPEQIFVIQASYTQGVINKMSFAAWGVGHFGHPNPERRE